ncbi:sensor domain-containing diguanylate cyclase [Paenibacillus sedimenti]|uniref:GGDEF domain-containing protein n=1 Tax=Paenibacillus sedimenti TaxID=2770274 RepID=A0A926QL33_9BACL|nr:sensor domain-containing diguanylate cyclase [Paenibacillus sedimenti]MBD0382438.1 GGDEF domain-containing protein [Paenibacillus sedimenti]
MLTGKADSENAKLTWHQTDRMMFQLIEQAWDLFCVFDIYGNLIYATQSFDRIVGFIPDSFEQVVEFIDSEYRMDVHKLFIKTLQTEDSIKLEFRAKRACENTIWLECTTLPIKDENGELVQISFALNDITLRKNQENRLISMAFHDPLTGLPNRRLFKEQMNQMLMQTKRTGRSLALLYLDIDDFKIINDTMGHDVGDAFLQEFAVRIQSCLRDIDIFARMGGDEFTILLPAVDYKEHVESIARRIICCMEQPWEVKGHTFRATVSMGITMYYPDSDGSTMMKQVDIALYDVKGKGRNNYQFFRFKEENGQE